MQFSPFSMVRETILVHIQNTGSFCKGVICMKLCYKRVDGNGGIAVKLVYSMPVYNKVLELLAQMQKNIYAMAKRMSGKIAIWQQRSDEHVQKQMINPFSEWEGACHRAKLSKDDKDYGKPVAGSSTERRGREAGSHISGEVVELCHVIADIGRQQPDGTYVVTFGVLFEAYTRISNKLVGMLMRARKQGLVRFEGEMLFQRRDDDVEITLVEVPQTQ